MSDSERPKLCVIQIVMLRGAMRSDYWSQRFCIQGVDQATYWIPVVRLWGETKPVSILYL